MTIQEDGFYITVHYPAPSNLPAGGGAAMFIFKQQSNRTYKTTMISCAGSCEDDNCE